MIFLFLCSCAQVPYVVFDSGAEFSVEIAKTDSERARGLMFRESLPENHGMLFFFEDEFPRAFWMKNTFISLDMIFLDKDFKVVEVKSEVQPCQSDPCESYGSLPSMYVLEINGGFAEKLNISAGSRMSFK